MATTTCWPFTAVSQLLPEEGKNGDKLTCFKAYDIAWWLKRRASRRYRGGWPCALRRIFKTETAVLGGDARLDSAGAAARWQMRASTCWISWQSGRFHFATFHPARDGGIEVTASHNPMGLQRHEAGTRGRRPMLRHRSARRSSARRATSRWQREAARGSCYRQTPSRAIDHPLGYISKAPISRFVLV